MRWLLWIFVCLAVPAQSGISSAQEPRGKPAAAASARSAPKAAAGPQRGGNPEAEKLVITPAREAAAMTFAREHHPELADLLEQLRKTNRDAYEQGVRDLFETSERLTRLRERFPQRYELALKARELDSRIKLLAARMSMSDSPSLEAELKAALLERLDVRKQQLEMDRERVASRLQRLDENIEQLEARREQMADMDLQRLKRSLGLNKKSAVQTKNPNQKQNQKPKAGGRAKAKAEDDRP